MGQACVGGASQGSFVGHEIELAELAKSGFHQLQMLDRPC